MEEVKTSDGDDAPEPAWRTKQREFEKVKARAKALRLRLTCTICGEKAKLNCPCGTTQYCSTDCQRIDWRDRGHRKACKKIRDERAAEAARAEAPTPPPPEEIVYGPAPRSHADEVRARIAAEHEAARARREANPEEPETTRMGSRCPICLEAWDVKPERDLRGKVFAVDLSLWLVQAALSPLLKAQHKHPHLFLAYSRATFFLRLGARLVVVVDGARDPRKRWRGGGDPSDGNGARCVVRQASVSGVESGDARIHRVSDRPWSRRDVVALGLCCGTDLDDGVPLAGPRAAVAFLGACRRDGRDALDALRAWRDEAEAPDVADAPGGRIEAHCRARAWPPEDLIRAYLAAPAPELAASAFEWRKPSAEALEYANAAACIHGHHAHTSMKSVAARLFSHFVRTRRVSQPAAQPPQPPPKTYVVTVATDASLLDVYLRSAELHGLPEPVVLGAGEPWRGPTLDERFCGGFKWVLLRRWLKTVPNNAIVVFTDAYDVFWNAPLPSNLLDDGVDVLFAGEPTCWPDPSLADRYPPCASPYRFVNSGCFVGRARALKALVARASARDDDQLLATLYYLRDPVRARVDSACSRWQCLGGVGTLGDGELAWAPGSDGRPALRNARHGTTPCAVHGNGDGELQAQWRALAAIHLREPG
ncbi:hypothetical protein SO694_00001463 [Aureococcus anophagefferens]|uniref:MYND-type domain-containing protein n=1 Tax=Aureococcus anophagefferens TaxID=44056 RepID=A0ABR1GC16_AURAN